MEFRNSVVFQLKPIRKNERRVYLPFLSGFLHLDECHPTQTICLIDIN